MRHADHRLGEFPRAVVPLLQVLTRTFLSARPVVDLLLLPEPGRPCRRCMFGLAGAAPDFNPGYFARAGVFEGIAEQFSSTCRIKEVSASRSGNSEMNHSIFRF